ncbi:MAG TPA: TIR domain-containing protein [Beijerinckia sp.]|nr:TIR domain-containing protein [Beijerinckia sp.]
MSNQEDFCSMAKTRVFVCFKNSELDSMNTLLDWDKDQEFDFVFENDIPKVAINSAEGKQAKSELTEKIKSASHLLCLIGKDTGNNDWINWQVQTASVKGRKVIAVRLHLKNKSPASLLNFGSTFATSFTFDAIKKAIDAGESTSEVMPPPPDGASRFDNL